LICHSTIFVTKGCLRSYYLYDEKFQILQFAIDNWWIGDLKSFLRQTPSEMYIDAVANTEILQVSHQNLQILYKQFPKFERFFRLLMENTLIAHQNRIVELHTLTAKERYENFKKNYHDFHNSISQKDIANYLGMPPEYLSSLRNYKTISIALIKRMLVKVLRQHLNFAGYYP